MVQEEPIYDIAHLAHVELLTPKLEESLRFFVDVMGMTENGRKEDSVYLRGWDDYEHGIPYDQPAGAAATGGRAGNIWPGFGLE
jgi:catechol 2,3-dioxygenase-like lactoylglutathione lyase family enzyme